MVLRKNEKGFTLVEIMVVVVIMAIAAAAAGVQMKNRATNRRVKNAAADMFSAFQQAKMQAVNNRANVLFILNPVSPSTLNNPSTYSLFIDDGSGGGIAGNEIPDGNEQILINAPVAPNFRQIPRNSVPYDVNMTINFNTAGNPGFNSRGLPYQGRIGSVVFDNNNDKNGDGDLTNDDARWYRISLSVAGYIKLEMSKNGADAVPVWQ